MQTINFYGYFVLSWCSPVPTRKQNWCNCCWLKCDLSSLLSFFFFLFFVVVVFLYLINPIKQEALWLRPLPLPSCRCPEIKPANNHPKMVSKEVNKLGQRHPVQNSSHIKVKIGSKTWLALLSLWEGNAKQRLRFRAPLQPKTLFPINQSYNH